MQFILQMRDLWCLRSFHFISFLYCQFYYFFSANGYKIESQVDSGFQTLLDSGFHINVDSGFQFTAFRISIAKISSSKYWREKKKFSFSPVLRNTFSWQFLPGLPRQHPLTTLGRQVNRSTSRKSRFSKALYTTCQMSLLN